MLLRGAAVIAIGIMFIATLGGEHPMLTLLKALCYLMLIAGVFAVGSRIEAGRKK